MCNLINCTYSFEVYTLLPLIHASQSSVVMDVNAASTAVSRSSLTISGFFKQDLTFEKHSSIGFRSGEYGGKKCNSAPTSPIRDLLHPRDGLNNCPL